MVFLGFKKVKCTSFFKTLPISAPFLFLNSTPSQNNLIKNAKLSLKKLKNTASAQLCFCGYCCDKPLLFWLFGIEMFYLLMFCTETYLSTDFTGYSSFFPFKKRLFQKNILQTSTLPSDLNDGKKAKITEKRQKYFQKE